MKRIRLKGVFAIIARIVVTIKKSYKNSINQYLTTECVFEIFYLNIQIQRYFSLSIFYRAEFWDAIASFFFYKYIYIYYPIKRNSLERIKTATWCVSLNEAMRRRCRVANVAARISELQIY